MKHRILVVEDDNDLSSLIKTLLEQNGFEVYTDNNGISCLERVNEINPHLILMDIMLPDISGADVVKKIREDPLVGDIPVIFLSGLISREEQDSQEKGVVVDGINYKILSKPFESKHLIDVINSEI